jgi:hypothetical protein
MPLFFGGPGATPSLGNLPGTNELALQAGAVFPIPSGWFECKSLKGLSVIQEYDPILQTWRTVGGGARNGSLDRIKSDGANYRLANQTGCAVGALLTNAGTGYTSAPVVTASAGGSVWRAVMGQVVSSVTVNNGGVLYTYPPIVCISAPPPGGIQATGYATLTSGAVSSITLTNQGGGYTAPPTIFLMNDPREGQNGTTVGYGASAVAVMGSTGTVTGVICVDHGTPLTSLPTLAFTGGGGSSAAATTIMDWTMTGYTVSGGGTVYSGSVLVSAFGGFPGTSPAYTNPDTQSNLVIGRAGLIQAALSGGAITATGLVVLDGGIYPGVPSFITYYNTPPATVASLVITVGGATDNVVILGT